MLRLLLDGHISTAVARGVVRRRPVSTIACLHEWHGGLYRSAIDSAILEAAAKEHLTS